MKSLTGVRIFDSLETLLKHLEDSLESMSFEFLRSCVWAKHDFFFKGHSWMTLKQLFLLGLNIIDRKIRGRPWPHPLFQMSQERGKALGSQERPTTSTPSSEVRAGQGGSR